MSAKAADVSQPCDEGFVGQQVVKGASMKS